MSVKYENVIFDLDGTLTLSDEGITACVRYALEKMGRPVPESDLRKFIGPPLVTSFKRFCGMDESTAWEAVRLYRERYTTIGRFENRVITGIPRLLRRLRREGASVSIATGKPRKTSLEILEHFGISSLFDRVEGPDDAVMSDSKRELVKKTLAGMHSVMVGDREFDILGARDNNIESIGVTFGYGSREELESAGATNIASSVDELEALLCGDVEKPPRGLLISVEGLDGSGKTTQIGMLSDFLPRCGYEVMHTREPGGCPISEKLREIVLDKDNPEMTAKAEVLIYAAARAQHAETVLEPALRAGKLVLCDRYIDSSAAFQGGGRELGLDTVMRLNQYATGGLMPDKTIYLRIDDVAALKRRSSASELDRIEREKHDFHRRVFLGFDELAKEYKERYITVDASKAPCEVFEQIRAAVSLYLTEVNSK